MSWSTNLIAIIKGVASNWTYIVIAALALASWHYLRSSDSWQRTAQHQQQRAETAEAANATLATANTVLTQRNSTLVHSLNERHSELEHQRQRADANRRAYREALDKDSDWGSTRIPGDIARSLRTGASLQDATGNQGSAAQRTD